MGKAKKSRGKLLIGVDLGGTNVRAGLVGGGKILDLAAQPIHGDGSKQQVFDDLCAVIEAVLKPGVRGIGLGVPSLVDPKTGVIDSTTNIASWQNVPLRRMLEKKFGLPVRLDNDANCFALGERLFGHGRGCENFVGLITGTGLGAGLISGGRLHSGVHCGAGEFGMLPYGDSIIEHYAAGQFFHQFGIEGAELSAQAAKGDAKALRIYREYGSHLAYAFKAILYAFAPEMIVLGGSVSKAYKHYEPSLRDGLADFRYPIILRKLKIRISRVPHVAVLGAASLVE